MSNDRYVEKGMFLRGGTYPARIAHSADPPSILDDHKALKARLQHLKEALDYIRNEKPSGDETQEEWLRRMGWG